MPKGKTEQTAAAQADLSLSPFAHTARYLFMLHRSVLGLLLNILTLVHSERPKLCTILAFLSAIGLIKDRGSCWPLQGIGHHLSFMYHPSTIN